MDKIILDKIPDYGKSVKFSVEFMPIKSHKRLMFSWKWPFIHILTVIDKAELLSVSPAVKEYSRW